MENELTAKRMGTVEEFSDLAAFLCSEQAAYISGQSISIDGGNSTNFYWPLIFLEDLCWMSCIQKELFLQG